MRNDWRWASHRVKMGVCILNLYGIAQQKMKIKDFAAFQLLAAIEEEFLLSAVLATIAKWDEMKQPISISELGTLIVDVLQHGFF